MMYSLLRVLLHAGVLCLLILETNCNKTWRSADYEDTITKPVSVSLRVRSEDHRKPVKCLMNFEGKANEVVEVKVRSLRAGRYDTSLGTCTGGHLKIFDGLTFNTANFWPTVLCGYYEQDVPIKRFSSQSSSKVEFFVLKANTQSGFEIDVTFYDKGHRKGLRSGYGSFRSDEGKIPGTKCDWIIPVQDCSQNCVIVTPGYPGIYPPNTKCRYYLNNEAGKRVELLMSSNFNVKFDIKKSDDCNEDYVKVFEGNTTSSPLIGKFCGQDGRVMISKSESLLVEFNSGSGGPEWTYSGFEASVITRWGISSTGVKVPNTLCDMVFEEKEGTLNTADHKLPRGAICTYKFRANPNEKIDFDVSITFMSKDCEDYIEYTDEQKASEVKKICWEDLKSPGRRNEYKFQTKGPNATIRYIHNGGQISNREPIFIDYIFLSDPSYNATAIKDKNGYKSDGSTGSAAKVEITAFNLVALTITAFLTVMV